MVNLPFSALDRESLRQSGIDRRGGLAVVLIGVYGTAIGGYMLMSGYAKDPGWWRITALQALMLPVLFAAFYFTRRGDQNVVPLLAVAPPLGVTLLYVLGLPLWSSWPSWPEVMSILAALAVAMLAVSGYWSILGYLSGRVTRWRQEHMASKYREAVSWRWVLLGSAIILASYLGTAAV